MDKQTLLNLFPDLLKQPHSLTIGIDENAGTMTISINPDYSGEVIGFLFSLLFWIVSIILINEVGFTGQTFGLLFGLTIILGTVFYNAYSKRAIHCVAKKNFQIFQYHHGGLFGSRFQAVDLQISYSRITSFEIHRHVAKWADKYQLFAILANKEKIDLTGRMSFAESQSSTEKIRNFINPQLPIKAVD